MTILIEQRSSELYNGNGLATEFMFPFTVFADNQVVVHVSTESPATDKQLDETQYTVKLNTDQDTNPGGVVTLAAPLEKGVRLRITSAVPYTQETSIQNQSDFYPRAFDYIHDKLQAQIQQLLEELALCLKVPPSSDISRDEILEKLLDVAAKADEYVALVEKRYQEVLETKKEIEDLQSTVEESLAKKAEELLAEIKKAAEDYIRVIEEAGDDVLFKYQVCCQEQTWTPGSVASGTSLDLPAGMFYLAGHKHIRVTWNGLTLTRGRQWQELGDKDAVSRAIRIDMDLNEDDELGVFIVPLGPGEFASEIARIGELETKLNELIGGVA